VVIIGISIVRRSGYQFIRESPLYSLLVSLLVISRVSSYAQLLKSPRERSITTTTTTTTMMIVRQGRGGSERNRQRERERERERGREEKVKMRLV
jgi:hypothetical protein